MQFGMETIYTYVYDVQVLHFDQPKGPKWEGDRSTPLVLKTIRPPGTIPKRNNLFACRTNTDFKFTAIRLMLHHQKNSFYEFLVMLLLILKDTLWLSNNFQDVNVASFVLFGKEHVAVRSIFNIRWKPFDNEFVKKHHKVLLKWRNTLAANFGWFEQSIMSPSLPISIHYSE